MWVTYILFRIVVFLFAITPFWLLYLISDFLRFMLFRVVGYRTRVVEQNLKNSFPNMGEVERNRVMSDYYRNLSDIIVEGIKGFNMRRSELKKRYRFTNPQLMAHYFDNGIDVIGVGSHYANWEWGLLAAGAAIDHKSVAFYTKLTNPLVEKFMKNRRSKNGVEMVVAADARKPFAAERTVPTMFFFGGDQSPSNIKGAEWVTFLNQDTACMKGAEFFARRMNLPVVYFDIQRVKRGYYTASLKTLFEESRQTESGEITREYMATLERIIVSKPENYLWSHRRWKHKRENL